MALTPARRGRMRARLAIIVDVTGGRVTEYVKKRRWGGKIPLARKTHKVLTGD
jgi:hypothetical protein